MSEVLDPPVVEAPPRLYSPVKRAGLADINEMGPWLLPRIAEHWRTDEPKAVYWLRSAIPTNDQALIVHGDAIGMAHIEPGRMGHACRIMVDFVLSARSIEGVDDCKEIYEWFATWAKSLGALGLYRLDDFSDADRSYIRSWMKPFMKAGQLFKQESVAALF